MTQGVSSFFCQDFFFQCQIQLIGLRETLQEHPIFHGKIGKVSGEDFPFNYNSLSNDMVFTEHLFA